MFLRAVEDHPLDDGIFTGLLEKLYMLHGAKFFALQPANHQQLTVELAKRKPGKEGYHYALEYPEDKEAQLVIQKFESQNPLEIKPVTMVSSSQVP